MTPTAPRFTLPSMDVRRIALLGALVAAGVGGARHGRGGHARRRERGAALVRRDIEHIGLQATPAWSPSGGVSCRTARRVAKAYDSSGRLLGRWKCGLAHNDRPRLFSCGAGAGSGDLRRFPRALEAIGTNRRGAASRCGSVSYGGRGYVLFYKGITCTSARRKVRHVHRYKRLRGWTCSSGSNFRTGGFCRRGARQFGWHPGD